MVDKDRSLTWPGALIFFGGIADTLDADGKNCVEVARKERYDEKHMFDDVKLPK